MTESAAPIERQVSPTKAALSSGQLNQQLDSIFASAGASLSTGEHSCGSQSADNAERRAWRELCTAGALSVLRKGTLTAKG
jgi:hypothetical protein